MPWLWNELRLRLIKYLKMTVCSSVMWNIHTHVISKKMTRNGRKMTRNGRKMTSFGNQSFYIKTEWCMPDVIEDSSITKISTTEANWWNRTSVKFSSWFTMRPIMTLLGFTRTVNLLEFLKLSERKKLKFYLVLYIVLNAVNVFLVGSLK